MVKQKIRIRLKAYESRILDESAARIVEVAKKSGANVSGPIPLPTEKNVYCELRSPHIDKKSREHFELRTHKHLLDIYIDPEQKTVAALEKMELPAGVDIEIKG